MKKVRIATNKNPALLMHDIEWAAGKNQISARLKSRGWNKTIEEIDKYSFTLSATYLVLLDEFRNNPDQFNDKEHLILNHLLRMNSREIKHIFVQPAFETGLFVLVTLGRLCLDAEEYLKKPLTQENFCALARFVRAYAKKQATVGRNRFFNATLNVAFAPQPFAFERDVTDPSDITFTPIDKAVLFISSPNLTPDDGLQIVRSDPNYNPSPLYVICPALNAGPTNERSIFEYFILRFTVAMQTGIFGKDAKANILTQALVTPASQDAPTLQCPYNAGALPRSGTAHSACIL